MKKYLVSYVIVFACFAQSSFAQLKVNNPLAQKQPLLQIPMVHITAVSSLFVPVHIDTVTPFAVTLSPIVYGNHESAACARFKKLKPALELKAAFANSVTANLDWQTKYAFYATGFDIERSLDDSLHFYTIHFASVAKGTGFKKTYRLPDYNDYSGLSFYRVKQRNGETGFVYSNIVSIKGFEAVPFKLYPVPAHDKVFINITPRQSGNLSIMICDLAGKTIQQLSVICTANGAIERSIDVSRLVAGLYQVRILMPDKTFVTGKFIKE